MLIDCLSNDQIHAFSRSSKCVMKLYRIVVGDCMLLMCGGDYWIGEFRGWS